MFTWERMPKLGERAVSSSARFRERAEFILTRGGAACTPSLPPDSSACTLLVGPSRSKQARTTTCVMLSGSGLEFRTSRERITLPPAPLRPMRA